MGDDDKERSSVVAITHWIEWIRTLLTPSEVEVELSRLSAFARAQLEDDHWVWMPGRVLWLDPSGVLRRARFTHGTHFRTAKSEFYVDSVGRVHLVPDMKSTSPSRTSSRCRDYNLSAGTEAEMNDRRITLMPRTFPNVLARSRSKGVDLRTAALLRGIGRVTEAKGQRGAFP